MTTRFPTCQSLIRLPRRLFVYVASEPPHRRSERIEGERVIRFSCDYYRWIRTMETPLSRAMRISQLSQIIVTSILSLVLLLVDYKRNIADEGCAPALRDSYTLYVSIPTYAHTSFVVDRRYPCLSLPITPLIGPSRTILSEGCAHVPYASYPLYASIPMHAQPSFSMDTKLETLLNWRRIWLSGDIPLMDSRRLKA